ncbi:ATP-grasp domain-containing protein [Halomonas eurihalina]|uniref:ATP-grasp domain-containing protein n=1 Tax=Halomonas eurihalina TaxID=42566 RepID=A0A5D9DE19_HALER|nr:ATP-grasp domain-containing protein [Halomonas eurihalina]MDR5859271.1 ATP-grasp domain-containing protein [Halomonas eurihalina]TZG40905.1 ATP-grasp domain-containing protein [Halomonas eurihalina]
MTVLILNRSAMSYSAYHEWFDLPPETPLIYFSSPGRRDLSGPEQVAADCHYAKIREYADYDTSDQLECDVLDLHAHSPVRAIVAMSEWDQVRAGRLRRLLGLSGTEETTATAYRDKLIMKEYLSRERVPVTEFCTADNMTNLVEFIERVGYPVIVKPRLMAGSVGLNVLSNFDDLSRFAQGGFGPAMETQHLQMVEKLVNVRTEYHIDGIIVDGSLRFIWPSRYVGAVSDFASDSLFGAIMLSPDHPQRKPLCALVERTIQALPDLTTSTFHAEVFETEDGQLLLNEIGCRTGGFRVNDLIKAGFGLWLNREWARLQAGLVAHVAPPELPKQLAGYLLLRPRQGIVREIPSHCPMPWIFDYRTDARPGDCFAGNVSSTSQLASVVVTGQSESDVEQRLQEVYEWFYAALRLEPIEVPEAKGVL